MLISRGYRVGSGWSRERGRRPCRGLGGLVRGSRARSETPLNAGGDAVCLWQDARRAKTTCSCLGVVGLVAAAGIAIAGVYALGGSGRLATAPSVPGSVLLGARPPCVGLVRNAISFRPPRLTNSVS